MQIKGRGGNSVFSGSYAEEEYSGSQSRESNRKGGGFTVAEKGKAAETTESREMQMKETELLYGASDRYGIYQLRDAPELCRLRFKGTWSLKQAGIIEENAVAFAVRPENYDLVYVGDLSELAAKTAGLYTQEDKLHALFEEFNIYQPPDYRGHSLSVGDIVVLHEGGKNSAHYVDTVGYTEMSHFVRRLENMKEKGQEADRIQPEGRHVGKEPPGKGSLREKLAECKMLSADAGKNHPAKKQKKELLR